MLPDAAPRRRFHLRPGAHPPVPMSARLMAGRGMSAEAQQRMASPEALPLRNPVFRPSHKEPSCPSPTRAQSA